MDPITMCLPGILPLLAGMIGASHLGLCKPIQHHDML